MGQPLSHSSQGSKDTEGFLKVKNGAITLDDKPVVLKGAGLGGWMNMENFITGYPGHEFQARAALKAVLGEEKYEFFFDKFLEYFFDEKDAEFYASLGLNCLRLPVNYRHFQDDMAPDEFKAAGFKHLDRVVELCAKHHIYTIIDLHALPGGQNPDWHCDSGLRHATCERLVWTRLTSVWIHKDFQDRAVRIWEEIAKHYRDNPWVAGYNPVNEPVIKDGSQLWAFYERVEKAIRAVDPNHILFLDGNTFAEDFSAFGDPLPNTVYSCHDYSAYGFPNQTEPFEGKPEQLDAIKRQFEKRTEYMRKHNVPAWVGEFGPIYHQASDDVPDWETVNSQRRAVLQAQLDNYDSASTSWSIWLYKDMGAQGMLVPREDSAYRKLLAPFVAKKRALAVDSWNRQTQAVDPLFAPMEEWLTENSAVDKLYPWGAKFHLSRAVRETLLSEALVDEFAAYFKDKTREELDTLAASFKFEECIKSDKLNAILKKDAERGRSADCRTTNESQSQ